MRKFLPLVFLLFAVCAEAQVSNQTVNARQAGTWSVTVSSSALPTGAATEATLAALNAKVTTVNTGAVTISAALPAGNNNIGDVDVASLPNVTIGNGQVAHDSPVAGSPVHIGGVSRTVDPTAVVAGDVSYVSLDTLGKVVTMPYSFPARAVTGSTGFFNSAAEQIIIAAPGSAGLRTYLTSCIFANSSSGPVDFFLRYAGVITTALITVGANDTVTVSFPMPLRSSDNASWGCILGGGAADSVACSCNGYIASN